MEEPSVYYVKYNSDICIYEINKFGKLLTEEEREELSRLNFSPRKIKYIIGRIFLKKSLANYLSKDLNEIKLKRGETGKLYIDGEVKFNISYTDGCIALVLSDSSPVSVDIELLKERGGELEKAKRFFTKDEFDYIRKNADSISAFYEIWTKKEAYLKFTSEGLYRSLASFSVLRKELECKIKTVSIDKRYWLSVAFSANNHCRSNKIKYAGIEFKDIIGD